MEAPRVHYNLKKGRQSKMIYFFFQDFFRGEGDTHLQNKREIKITKEKKCIQIVQKEKYEHPFL